MLDREVARARALAVSLLGDDQELLDGIDHLHADHLVAGLQPDAGDTHRVAAHRPDLDLVETCRLPLASGQDDVVLAIGQANPPQLVAADQADRDQPVVADLCVLCQRGLLDLPPRVAITM